MHCDTVQFWKRKIHVEYLELLVSVTRLESTISSYLVEVLQILDSLLQSQMALFPQSSCCKYPYRNRILAVGSLGHTFNIFKVPDSPTEQLREPTSAPVICFRIRKTYISAHYRRPIKGHQFEAVFQAFRLFLRHVTNHNLILWHLNLKIKCCL